MIETRLLRQFVAVAEELHFHRAAERLHMAQPPLSQAIRRLEEEIGAKLLDRTNRKVVLTAAGASFLETARRVLADLGEGADRARRIAAGIEGRLTVSFVDSAHHGLVPAILRAFRARHPRVELVLREGTSAEQVELLRAGESDVGLMRRPGAAVPGLTFETITREAIVAALPEDHEQAGRATVQLADLARDGFILPPRAKGAGFHDQMVTLCRLAGFSPRIVQEARQMQTIVGLVAGGLGVSLVPASAAAVGRGGAVFRPISVDAPPDLLHLDLMAGWNDSRSSPIRGSFLAIVREVAMPDTPHISKSAS